MNFPPSRVVCITLARRSERWGKFQRNLAGGGWPFPPPVRFEAIDGDRYPPPVGWKDGGGAWGCLQSHRQVLAETIGRGENSVMVMEDDAVLRDGFPERLSRFLADVPSDWECLMLGGQHWDYRNQMPSIPREGVIRCANCQRTHAYVVRGRALMELRRQFSSWEPSWPTGHADHIMGPFMARFNTYAPDPFLIGQDENTSDINGGKHPRKFWDLPDPDTHFLLRMGGGKPDADALRRGGLHMGYCLEPVSGMDAGIHEAMDPEHSLIERDHLLAHWCADVLDEAAAVCSRPLIWLPSPSKRIEESLRRLLGPQLEVENAA